MSEEVEPYGVADEKKKEAQKVNLTTLVGSVVGALIIGWVGHEATTRTVQMEALKSWQERLMMQEQDLQDRERNLVSDQKSLTLRAGQVRKRELLHRAVAEYQASDFVDYKLSNGVAPMSKEEKARNQRATVAIEYIRHLALSACDKSMVRFADTIQYGWPGTGPVECVE